jgi:hypothetical protein
MAALCAASSVDLFLFNVSICVCSGDHLLGQEAQVKISIELTPYHVANLRALIEACGYPGGAVKEPIGGCNTGDWLGEIYLMLPEVDCRPNISAEQMAQYAQDRADERRK